MPTSRGAEVTNYMVHNCANSLVWGLHDEVTRRALAATDPPVPRGARVPGIVADGVAEIGIAATTEILEVSSQHPALALYCSPGEP